MTPATGLLPNKMKHGEEWEREGSVSYFDNGKLRVCDGCWRSHSRRQQPPCRAAERVSSLFPPAVRPSRTASRPAVQS